MKRSKTGFVTCLVMAGVLALAFGAVAHEGHDHGEKMPPIAQPGPEHKRLQKAVGSWTARTTMYEGDQAMTTEATEEVTSLHGGLWIEAKLSGSMAGMPFTGHACETYDPNTKKYVGVWFDSFTTRPTTYEGECDESGKTFTYMMKGVDPAGNATTMMMQTTWVDDDNRVMKMYAGPDASAPVGMEIVYTRK